MSQSRAVVTDLLLEFMDAEGRLLFSRLHASPTTLGSDPSRASCTLDARLGVQPVHVELEAREGRLYARDLAGGEGTAHFGRALAHREWVALGSSNQRHALGVGVLTVWITAQPADAMEGAAGEPAFVEAAGHHDDPAAEVPSDQTVWEPRVAHPDGASPGTPAPPRPSLVNAAEAARVALAQEKETLGRFCAVLVDELRGLPPAAQDRIASDITARYPDLAADARVRAVFGEGHAMMAPATDGVAVRAMEQLGAAFIGPAAAPRAAGEVQAFAKRLSAGIHELLVAVTAILATTHADGADASSAGPMPGSAGELGRLLFDWRESGGRGAQWVRAAARSSEAARERSRSALLNAVQAVLDDLSPGGIVHGCAEERKKTRGVLGKLFRAAPQTEWWDAFVRRHQRLSEPNGLRARLLGSPFGGAPVAPNGPTGTEVVLTRGGRGA